MGKPHFEPVCLFTYPSKICQIVITDQSSNISQLHIYFLSYISLSVSFINNQFIISVSYLHTFSLSYAQQAPLYNIIDINGAIYFYNYIHFA